MKVFFKKYRFWIISFIFLYIYLLFILVCPTNFNGITPYGLSDVSTNIVVDNKEEDSSNFYTISVLTYSYITPFQKMILDSIDSGETYEKGDYYSVLTDKDEHLMGQIEKESSYQISVIKAYEKAGKPISYSFKGMKIHYVPKGIEISGGTLKIGDLITSESYDDITYANEKDNYSYFMNVLNQKSYELTKKDGSVIKVNMSEAKYKIEAYPFFDITSTTPDISLPGLSSDTGGPSGGLIQSLYIYSRLMGLEKKSIISGTGTMEYNGEVGKIGGAKEKYMAARKSGVDYFFCPEENYKDIEELDKKYNAFKVIVVSSLDEAIASLENIS
jgi:PDZ domain-containing protein